MKMQVCATCFHFRKRNFGGICIYYVQPIPTVLYGFCGHHLHKDTTLALPGDDTTVAALARAGSGPEASPPDALAQMREAGKR